MKIIIENTKFDFDLGCRLLKLKHQDCPYEQLEDMWDSIEPLTFKEIAQMENLEQRRIGVLCMGLERLVKQVKPKLIDTQTIKKVTNYIDKNGNLVEQKFSDTYELYQVKGENFGKTKNNWNRMEDCHFVKFKDTSTDREYMIWVDLKSVWETNLKEGEHKWYNKDTCKVNAIQCIAWTMQTNVAKGNIEAILRQGDCIFVKPKDSARLSGVRHLTEKEYKKLLVAES